MMTCHSQFINNIYHICKIKKTTDNIVVSQYTYLSVHLLAIIIHTSSDMHTIVAIANSIHPITSTASRPEDVVDVVVNDKLVSKVVADIGAI